MDKGRKGLTFLYLDAPLRPSAVVVARDPLVRSGLVAVLGAYPGLVLREARPEAEGAAPADVVIGDAPDAARPRSSAPFLALVSTAQEARQALRSGARGALSRSAPASTIAPAALAVAAGHWVLDEAFAAVLLQVAAAPVGPPSLLSPREQEVLGLLSEGLSNREIAGRLGISRHTAKFHVNAILDKLGATTRTEAVVLAARSGLLSL
ncbi:MAG: response regulator transcription factor [Myxococcales bacterium]|nr:MAG: response regulator transcription factor [Myxococcales bacterium]